MAVPLGTCISQRSVKKRNLQSEDRDLKGVYQMGLQDDIWEVQQ